MTVNPDEIAHLTRLQIAFATALVHQDFEGLQASSDDLREHVLDGIGVVGPAVDELRQRVVLVSNVNATLILRLAHALGEFTGESVPQVLQRFSAHS